jgi:CO/xanthine dehydrogenase Mo-binding subunit
MSDLPIDAPALPHADEAALHALHLRALREGRSRQLVAQGDAEGRLWDAARGRIVQRVYPGPAGSPVPAAEIRALLGDDGRPVAWWQRVVAAPGAGAKPLPYAVAHQSVYAIEVAEDDPAAASAQSREQVQAYLAFCAESFIDELALRAGQDPLRYRRALLPAGSRPRRLLEAVAEGAGWDEPLPRGSGRGIAMAQSSGVLVAEVVEATVDARGQAAVRRVVTMDDDGAVRCAGSTRNRLAWPTLAAAFANALFAASGQRIRTLPLAAPALALP